jgi:uncharacterized protein YgiM (DUF1202 family)
MSKLRRWFNLALIALSCMATLAATPSQASAASTANRSCEGVVTVALTNVRNGPGLDYDIVTQLPHGSAISAVGLDLTARWYIVYLPQEGNVEPRWIFRKNIRLTGGCVKALMAKAANADR